MAEKSGTENTEVVTPETTEESQVSTTPEGAVISDTGAGAEMATQPEAKTEETKESLPEKTILGKALAEENPDASPDKTAKAALGGKDGKAATSQQELAPVEYTDFTAPEGVEISTADMARAKEAFSKARLPQNQAQEYLDMHLAEVSRHVKAYQQKQFDDWMEMRHKWQSDFQADTEIGGNRVKTTLQAGRGLIQKYGTPGLIEAIDTTGVGDHPEFIRFLSRLSESHQETSNVVEASTPITTEERAARRYKASAQG